jgi:4-alpha-glucanotransferase
MTDRKALLRLAKLVGVEANYTDALGQTREASNDSLKALIAAFGLPSNPAAAEAWLADSERATPFGLGPVQIVHAEDPHPTLPLRIAEGARAVGWTCRFEDGEEQSGHLSAPPEAGRLALPPALPEGYHRLMVEAGALHAEVDLIVAPLHSYLPPGLLPKARNWGLTCQLYGLRSGKNWGIGDFSDLAALGATAGSHGAAVLGLNPLHARFAAEPHHISPYSPSSRTWLDYLSIDPKVVPGFAEDESVGRLVQGEWFGATHWAACSAEFVDYGAAAACKRPVLEALYRRFRTVHLGEGGAQTVLGHSFRDFQRQGGRSLADFAVFEALHEVYCHAREGFSWRHWPAPMRDPRSAEVAAFAGQNCERVEFFQFLQWEADRQLAAAAATARKRGLAIGFYRDLAVGADPHGADAWADQALVVPHASIGAPPDALSRAGQNWGLAPVNPLVLRRQRFAPFIACLRANMRHAGLLRIDHVMSLNRLFWVPGGMAATDGCYVSYPFDALLRLVALESRRQGCAVVGEDLGTVPSGFRETMRAANVLSYRVMMFERRSDGSFIPPGEYPPLAAGLAATHDLATLEGFWLGRDIAWRRKLSLYPDVTAEKADADERAADRRLLLDALVGEGLLAAAETTRFWSAAGEPVFHRDLGDAIQRYLARSRARLMLVQLEDLVGETEQANLPGTTDEHPNWRRRLSQTLEQIAAGAELPRLAALVEQERRRAAAT